MQRAFETCFEEIAGTDWSDKHHHFATGLVRFHHPMRFPNVLKAKHSRWFRLIATSSDLIGDGLERDVRQRKPGCRTQNCRRS